MAEIRTTPETWVAVEAIIAETDAARADHDKRTAKRIRASRALARRRDKA